MERFAVKIALLGDGGPEFFWIYPFAHIGDRFIGQIGNTPLTLAGPKKGDTISFGKRDIVDWMYMAVKWLPLSAAIRKLSYPLESLFLRNVGRNILRSRRKTRVTGHKSKPRHRASKAHRHRAVSRARKSARTSAGGSRATMLQRVLGRLSP